MTAFFELLLKPELIFSLLLLVLILLRVPVKPKIGLHIAADPLAVFNVIDVADGKVQDYGRMKVSMSRVEGEDELFRFSYRASLNNGSVSESEAFFKVAERVAGHRLVLERKLNGQAETNQLLRIEHVLTQTETGSKLHSSYEWGPRILIAQLLARADLLGGAYRIKGLAENGVANDRPYQIISMGIALVTGLASVAAFSVIAGLWLSVLLVMALFVHELGHLIAYRLMGQPWGRMMFLPFLGAMAMPKLPHHSQAQLIFASLMGPGFSVLLTALCAALVQFRILPDFYLAGAVIMGLVTAGINLFNLIPVEPLDGGVALRSMFSWLIPKHVRAGLLTIASGIIAIGFWLEIMLLPIVGAVAFIVNSKARPVDPRLRPLTRIQAVLGFAGYAAILVLHLVLGRYLLSKLSVTII